MQLRALRERIHGLDESITDDFFGESDPDFKASESGGNDSSIIS